MWVFETSSTYLSIVHKRPAKALARLCRCAGLPEPLLFADVIISSSQKPDQMSSQKLEHLSTGPIKEYKNLKRLLAYLSRRLIGELIY